MRSRAMRCRLRYFRVRASSGRDLMPGPAGLLVVPGGRSAGPGSGVFGGAFTAVLALFQPLLDLLAAVVADRSQQRGALPIRPLPVDGDAGMFGAGVDGPGGLMDCFRRMRFCRPAGQRKCPSNDRAGTDRASAASGRGLAAITPKVLVWVRRRVHRPNGSYLRWLAGVIRLGGRDTGSPERGGKVWSGIVPSDGSGNGRAFQSFGLASAGAGPPPGRLRIMG